MRFSLTLLGTNSALPAHGRHPTAQVLNIQERQFLIDCGEGTQMRMLDFSVRKARIRQIFISHLHGDHFYGLIGLLTSYGLNGRKEPMEIFSPAGLEEIIEVQFHPSGGGLPYPVKFSAFDPDRPQLLFENSQVEVHSFPLLHSIPTAGFLFREKDRPRNIRPEKIEEYEIHFSKIPSIKQGADLELPNGRFIPNAELTLDPPRSRSYAYCSDTQYTEDIIPYIKGVDLLYHESTFCDDHKDQTLVTMHSTARQAATIARKAGVGALILGHYSSRYKELDCFEQEAKEVFSNSVLGLEGREYEIPLKKD
jgi:ribonuclease Z